MKNIFKSLMLVAVAAMGFTACQKTGEEQSVVKPNEVEMTVNVDMDDTRTYIDETNNVVKWSEGDQLMVVENEATFRKTTNIAIDAEGKATFTVSFPEKAGEVTYNAIFPASAVNTGAGFTDEGLELQVKSTQRATADSFDATADLLVAKQLELDAQPEVLNMQFKRIVALGKITLKGMDEGSNIKQVSFTAGEYDVLAGRNLVDVTSATVSAYGNANATNVITVNYEEAISTRDIYFVCNPFEMAAGEKFTVKVICDNAVYTREVEIPAGRTVTFTEGNLGTLSVDMSKGDKEKVEAATFATDTLTRATTEVPEETNYVSWSGKTGTSGAVYAGQSAGGNNSIQLRSNNSNSGIVTTASGGNVRKITVTWNAATAAARTLDIYGKNTEYTNPTELYSTSTQGTKIGSIKMGTTELEITGDYAYIGMRSYSGAMYIDEIQIEWQTSGGSGGGVEIVTPSFDLDQRKLSFDAEGGSADIEVETIDGFDNIVSAETDAEWLTIANNGYTFTVTAEENEGSARNATITFSADGCEDIVVAVSQNPSLNAAIEVTVAEFLEVEEDATLYRLRGTITGLYGNETNAKSYGNFYLTDDTGTVIIYGLLTPEGEKQKQWTDADLKVGDDIEVITVRTSYNGNAQGENAIYVEHVSPGTRAFWSFDTTSASFTSDGGEVEINVAAYNLKEEDVELEFEDGDSFEAEYENGVLTIRAEANSTTEELNATLYVRYGDLEQTITISQAASGEGGEVALGAPYSFDLTQKTWSNWGVGAKCGDYTWVPNKVSVNGSPTVGNKDGDGRGQQFGAAKTNQIKTMTMTCSDYTGGIKSLDVKACAKNGNTVTVTVTVGGVAMNYETNSATISSGAIETFNFTSDTALSGEIEITYSIKTAGALYVSGFAINKN